MRDQDKGRYEGTKQRGPVEATHPESPKAPFQLGVIEACHHEPLHKGPRHKGPLSRRRLPALALAVSFDAYGGWQARAPSKCLDDRVRIGLAHFGRAALRRAHQRRRLSVVPSKIARPVVQFGAMFSLFLSRGYQ